MALRKTATVLSLAVLVSFGISGCEGSFTVSPGETQTTQSSAPASSETAENGAEDIRKEAEATFNELKEFSQTESFKAFYDEMNTVNPEDPEAMAKIEAILDKHKNLEEELREKIELSPEALRAYQGIFAMSNANMENPYSEKFINSAIIFSSLADVIGNYTEMPKDASFGVTSNAVAEESGVVKLHLDGLFLKDSNNAVLNFHQSTFPSVTLKDEGKKILIENMDGKSEAESQDEASNDLLESDVKNAATAIETWIVYQGAEKVPLEVENGTIVSGKTDKGKLSFKISDSSELEFEGDSFAYIIKGTSKETGKKVIYDSAKGGLREVDPGTSTDSENKKPGSYDSNAFIQFRDSFTSSKANNLNAYVAYLNSDEYDSDATFEVIEKNGTEYVKVSDPNSKIVEEEVLYASPLN